MRKVKKENVIEITEEVKVGNVILEKGDKIEVLNEGYGWEIQRGKEFEAFEDAKEAFGAEALLDELALAMGTDQLGENLAYIFRNNDYQSPFIKD